MPVPPDLAVFAATSGHSGVDRVLQNLVPAIAAIGLRVDVLGVAGHGPTFDILPDGVRHLPLGARHVNSAVPSLIRYLRCERPQAMLSDKDRVNRAALGARALAGGDTRAYIRLGTTVSTNLASRPLLDRLVQRWSMRTFYRWADGIVVPSHGCADDLATFARLPRELIRVVPNPVVTSAMASLAEEAPPHPWLADPSIPVVLGVGELSERKDFATLIRAFARLRGMRRCRLLIFGEGRRRRELDALAEGLGVTDDVALPGFIANPYAAMSRAAVFALTSRWEGFGLVLAEALALGTPSVACDCPSGPAEILRNGEIGPLVAVGDDVGLAAALARMLEAPPPRATLIAAAEPFTAEGSARAYLAALGFREFM